MNPHTLDGKYKLRRKAALGLVGIVCVSGLVQMALPESWHGLHSLCEDYQFMAIGILMAGLAPIWEPDSGPSTKAASETPDASAND